jgi:thioesterase domain-containing protein/acyl carrier protein
LARYRGDGNIELLGRIDHQVKIRGFRIELGEIEAALAKHPDIQQAIVTAREDNRGDRRLVAYLVPKQKTVPPQNELRNFIRAKLPDYMIPSFFVALDTLPLTPNRKVNRQALPAPEAASSELSGGVTGPRNTLELRLLRIWEEVLNVKLIGVNDNFFDLGGHSLIAVRLFAEIEKNFGKKLPLALLFQAPTIEELATYLSQEEWVPSWSSLVAIQPSGFKPPFFCVHAHGGNVLNFRDLARCLGTDQPFYGLQALGLDGQQPRHSQIEEMASHYLSEIKTVQPHGPYFLGGYCFGGKVAFEMAHQLRAQGQEVSLLALIDAYAPGYRTSLPWGQRRVAQFRFHWRNLEKLEMKDKLSYINEKMSIAGTRLGRFMRRLAAKGLTFGLSRPSVLNDVRKIRPSMRPYSPKVYPGRITVFAPTESHSAYFRFESHLGWDRLAGEGLDIHEIPGKVASIIEDPYVKNLAQQLQACIERATAAKT